METCPDEMASVVQAGHEIALHGYTHENPLAMTPTQEAEVLDKCIDLIVGLSGKRPIGYAAPWWELSASTPELLLERGVIYDHSMMHRDFDCYRLRTGDSWTAIDYSTEAREWMHPLKRGRVSRLIEIPVSWYLDDLPPTMFIKKSPNSHGFMNPKDIEELWREQFDWVYREMDKAVFTFCLHPDVSGRPQVLMMLERLIDHIGRHPGVHFKTLEQIARDYDTKHPFGSC
ncbi:polysaccharide deacetylase family protein [Bradyrhizobium sp. LeoA1S1]|nr:polysaccharide deacetylase [Bradyrhizobium elkanii]